MVTPRRLLVVEDEALMASLLSSALTSAGFDVDIAGDVLQARESVRNFDPDAVLLDISLGDGPTGLDLAHVLHKQRPDIALIILTKFPDPRTAGVETTLIPPGCGFLRKDKVRDTDYLLQSIEAALTDRGGDIRDVEEAHPLSGLSAKHLAVLRLIATGYTNEHIATLKDASQSTVERWVVEIFRTLQIDTKGILNPRVEAARRFIAVAGIPERL